MNGQRLLWPLLGAPHGLRTTECCTGGRDSCPRGPVAPHRPVCASPRTLWAAVGKTLLVSVKREGLRLLPDSPPLHRHCAAAATSTIPPPPGPFRYRQGDSRRGGKKRQVRDCSPPLASPIPAGPGGGAPPRPRMPKVARRQRHTRALHQTRRSAVAAAAVPYLPGGRESQGLGGAPQDAADSPPAAADHLHVGRRE